MILEWIEEKLESIELRKRKPEHGICCTCQVCGHNYDDCTCEDEKILKKLRTCFFRDKKIK